MNDKLQFWQELKSGRFVSMVKESAKGQRLSNSLEAYNVLKPMLVEEDDVEKVYIIFQDAQNKILAIEKMFSGSITAASIYPREIIKRLIHLKASAFIMAHNHPSEDTTPSAEDKSITIKVGIAAASIDVAFHDHIIIGDGYYSMADNGLLKEITNGFSNLLKSKPGAIGAGISETIMNNENGIHGWKLNELAWEIDWWFDFFNIAFFKAQPVPIPAFSFEKTRVTNFRYHIFGRNAFGIKDNINLNRSQLNRPLWEILVTLLHEMTHSWQEMYGKSSNSWFHNKEFTLKMMDFGIICAGNGCHSGVGDPFVFLLNKYGIVFNGVMKSESDNILKIPPKEKPKGHSKLKKWSCKCTNIRVAVKEFEAKCLRCGNLFKLVSY